MASVNARDRIGTGPWHNATGALIANNLTELHARSGDASLFVDERGQRINGQWTGSPTPNQHDILTGSNLDGTSSGKTCNNWTSSGADATATVGHHDRQGGGANPTSWNNAHPSKGCSQQNLIATGGNGLFYCFAVK